MNSQDILNVNIVGAAAFLLWYALSRTGGKKPTQLNMKAKDSAPSLKSPLDQQLNHKMNHQLNHPSSKPPTKLSGSQPNNPTDVQWTKESGPQSENSQKSQNSQNSRYARYSQNSLNSELKAAKKTELKIVETVIESPEKVQKAKNLNVIFMYNAHTWDAYEVLGVPAGASIKTVTEAYQKALRTCDKESIEFFETAYKAILSKTH